jgi:hypothetical protein
MYDVSQLTTSERAVLARQMELGSGNTQEDTVTVDSSEDE